MKTKTAESSGISLEERLLQNAVDTVVKNLDTYDPVVLIHLMHAIATGRGDTHGGLLRIITQVFPKERLAEMGINSSAQFGDDLVNYLTIPEMHLRQIRGLMQLQERLMPAGMLANSADLPAAEASRMLAQSTSQLEKLLRMTKPAKAHADVTRLREAIAAGLEKVGKKLGKEVAAQALDAIQEGMRERLTETKTRLDKAMQEAEELGG